MVWNPEQVGGADQTAFYQGLGAAASKRQAYQADFGKSIGDEGRGVLDRNEQVNAAQGMRQAAQGNAPSQAAILGNQAADQSLQGQMAASANARGMGAAAAQMHAANAAPSQQLGAMGQMAGMRGAEMQHAQGAYGAAGGAMRTGDYAQQQMAQQRAEAQAQSENAQRQMNQGAQMGYEQMGVRNNQAQSEDELQQQRIQAQENNTKDKGDDESESRVGKWVKSGIGAVGTIASFFSDARMKTNVASLGAAAAPSGYEDTAIRGLHTLDSKDGGDTTLQWDNETKGPAGTHARVVIPGAEDSGDEGRMGGAARLGGSVGGKVNLADAERARAEAIAARKAAEATARPQGLASAAKRKMTMAELEAAGRELQGNVRAQSEAQLAPDEERLRRMGEEMRASQQASNEAQLQAGPSVVDHQRDPMGAALESGLRPFEYEYKPGFREQERQAPGEKNIGPMAQDMASNPITGSAVKQDPRTGMLMIDMPKATKLNSAGIGHLAAKQRRLENDIAALRHESLNKWGEHSEENWNPKAPDPPPMREHQENEYPYMDPAGPYQPHTGEEMSYDDDALEAMRAPMRRSKKGRA